MATTAPSAAAASAGGGPGDDSVKLSDLEALRRSSRSSRSRGDSATEVMTLTTTSVASLESTSTTDAASAGGHPPSRPFVRRGSSGDGGGPRAVDLRDVPVGPGGARASEGDRSSEAEASEAEEGRRRERLLVKDASIVATEAEFRPAQIRPPSKDQVENKSKDMHGSLTLSDVFKDASLARVVSDRDEGRGRSPPSKAAHCKPASNQGSDPSVADASGPTKQEFAPVAVSRRPRYRTNSSSSAPRSKGSSNASTSRGSNRSSRSSHGEAGTNVRGSAGHDSAASTCRVRNHNSNSSNNSDESSVFMDLSWGSTHFDKSLILNGFEDVMAPPSHGGGGGDLQGSGHGNDHSNRSNTLKSSFKSEQDSKISSSIFEASQDGYSVGGNNSGGRNSNRGGSGGNPKGVNNSQRPAPPAGGGKKSIAVVRRLTIEEGGGPPMVPPVFKTLRRDSNDPMNNDCVVHVDGAGGDGSEDISSGLGFKDSRKGGGLPGILRRNRRATDDSNTSGASSHPSGRFRRASDASKDSSGPSRRASNASKDSSGPQRRASNASTTSEQMTGIQVLLASYQAARQRFERDRSVSDRSAGGGYDGTVSDRSDRMGPSSSDRLGPSSSDRLGPSSSDRLGPSSSDRLGPSSSDRLGPSSSDRSTQGGPPERRRRLSSGERHPSGIKLNYAIKDAPSPRPSDASPPVPADVVQLEVRKMPPGRPCGGDRRGTYREKELSMAQVDRSLVSLSRANSDRTSRGGNSLEGSDSRRDALASASVAGDDSGRDGPGGGAAGAGGDGGAGGGGGNKGSTEEEELVAEVGGTAYLRASRSVWTMRIVVVFTFVVVSVIVTVLTHTFFRQMETDVLRGQFAEISATLLSITTKDLERKAGSARALSMMYTSLLGEELADNPDPTNYPPSVMLSPEASMCAATIVDQGGHWRTPWPYVTLPGHDRIGSALLDASGSRAGVFAALLNGKEGGVGTETTEWEAYATENALPLVKDVVANGIRISNSSTADMSGGHDQGHRDMAGTVLPMLRAPAWQVAPAEMMQEGIMWDYFSHLPYRDAIERILQFGAVEEIDEDEMTTAIHEDRGEGDAIMAAITELIPCTDTLLPLHLNPRRKEDPIEIKRADGHLHNHHEHRDLSDGLGEFCSAIFYPVYNAPLSSATPRIISGVVSEVFQWSDILQNIINPNAKFHKLRVVIESCLALPDGGCRPSAATYEINHLTGAHALGPGRITEPQHEPMVQSYNFSLPNDESMTYTIDVYPTDELCYEMGVSKEPIYLSIVAACFFLLSIIVFFVYDYFVNHRQKVVVRSAARSARIVRSLYPQFVRDNLFRPEGQHIRSDDRGAAVCIEAGHTGSTKEYDEEDPRSGSGNNDRALGLPTRRSSENGGFGGETRRKRGLKSKVSDFVDTPATQLRRFLTHPMPSHEYDYGLYREIGGVEPIAEVFEKTTVMLADIEGFTAWCSEREPSQVFRLLETVYREFDIEARKLGVFKVETVGDCYVAVTGLPDPRDDHAIVIAKYAVRCLLKFNVLTKRLEANLGPGTASLGMRFGLHSGPVMAGVLRGEKSRFQLFGDTINVASRMESTGEKNMIQASQDTADLLNASGKGHWLTPREGPVSAKGKGAIQTYWLQPNRRRPSMHGSLRASMSSTDSTHSTTPAVSLARALRQSWKCIGIDNDSLVAKERLIRWNAAILESFLLKIVDNRNAHSPPDMLQEQFIPSPEDKILSFSEKLSETVMFPDVAYRDDYYGVSSDIAISSEAQLELLEYVARIASMYRDVPFHNFDHASHVTMSANKLLNRVCTTFEDEEEDIASVAARTFGISADPLAQFVVVFSSLVHDVDHQGVPNAQLVKENDPLAAEFDNRSVAEKRSITLAWNILMQDRFLELQLLIFVNGDELRRFKQLLINTVLATDIADKERSRRGKSRWQKAFHPSQSSRGSAHLDESISSRLDEISLRSLKATLVFEQIMQASDVAHTMQHWETFKKWNERLYTELSKGFREGRGASDPRENWYGGEIGFFDFYIIPLAKKLKECGVFGSAASEYLDYALENRRRWEVEGNDIATRMIAENDALVASEAQKEAALINESPAKEEKMRPPEDESSPQNVANKNPCPQNEETTTKVGTPREVTTNDDLGEIV